jgi:hypothetical protein
MKTTYLTLALISSLPSLVSAAAFSAGDLAIVRLGDGAQTLGSSGNTAFIDDYTTGGTFAGSVQLPDSGPSSLIVSGSATSEGALSLSGDGHSLTIAGYNTARPFSGSLAGSSSSSVPRGIGLISANGTYTLAATTTSQFSGNNIRSGVTDGANNFWGVGATSGTYYFGNTAAAATVQSTFANNRVIQNFGGNLFFSTGSGTRGIYEISGTPTGSSSATILFGTGSTSSPYDFAFNSAMTTAYVADDTASGGIERWDLVAGTWTLRYTLGTGAAGIGARGLAVDFSAANAVIYATTAEATANRLITVTDTGASSSATTLATAASNEIFSGLELAPTAVPEPSALVLLGIGLAAAALRSRRE